MLRPFLLFLALAASASAQTFCTDEAATRASLRRLCDYILARPECRTIYLGRPYALPSGFYLRTLVEGYSILGDRRYLDAAEVFGDELAAKQSDRGYWGGNPKSLFLGDVGSALDVFVELYPHVSPERQQRYVATVRRYAEAVERDGFIAPSGAFGSGNTTRKKPGTTDEYTVPTAFNVEIFTWLYHRTKNEHDREVARKALFWMLDTMRADGEIEYVAGVGSRADPTKRGDPQNDFQLWDKSPYQVSAYVGAAAIAFERYCDQPAWQKEVRDRLGPHIEFLLRTQNADGTWGFKDRERVEAGYDRSYDQKRSPGVINVLIWYHERVKADPRIAAAVRKFDAFLLVPAQAKTFGLLDEGGAGTSDGSVGLNDVLTSMTGRALADLISPGIGSKW